MPNDTDFTIVRRHGGSGLNYAFIGREVDYHAPGSTVARLENGSVQHMGEQVLAMAGALLAARDLPARAPDLVYADVLGLVTLAYPPAIGWLLVGIALAGVAIATQRAFVSGARWRTVWAGAGGAMLVLVAAAAVAWLAGHWVGAPDAPGTAPRVLQDFGPFEVALGLCSLGVALAAAALAGARQPGSWAGALWFAWVIAAVAQGFAPATAFLFTWPLWVAIAAALLLGVDRRHEGARPLRFWFAMIGTVIALAQCAYLGHGVLLGVGASLPMVVALFAWLASINLWPWLAPLASRSRNALLGGAVLAMGLLLAAGIRWLG
jgi:hypothetical protein